MREPFVGGSLQLCVVEFEIAEHRGNGGLMIPCGRPRCAHRKHVRQMCKSIPQQGNRPPSEIPYNNNEGAREFINE